MTTVSMTAVCADLANQLVVLQTMLKTDALSTTWQLQHGSWRTRMMNCHEPKELELAVNELEQAIQWNKILINPATGAPLTPADMATGLYGVGGAPSVQLPPPLATVAPPTPPEGVPRAASRMLLLLHDMGAAKYDPKVAVQLLDFMYGYTAGILVDASANARMRMLPTSSQLAPFQPG